MRARYDILVVGAGHGGAQAAISLRQRKFVGTIAVVGDEPELPYERPPLSKDYLAREKPFERLLIRPASFWAEREVDMLTGLRIASVDPENHSVVTEDGAAIGYGQMIWAAGGHPRRLSCPGADLSGVHSIRTRADIDRIMDQLAVTTRVVVIGGGYVGLEVAAVLAKLGKTVIVLEALDRVLARVAGVVLSRFYEAEHRAHGVDVRLGVTVERLEGNREGAVSGVRLADGELISAEMVIVGIGIVPAVEPLRVAGAECGNGVAIDECGRTSLPEVFAIGDCALHANRFSEGLPIRLESVQNANDLATTVAKAITGLEEAYHATPWFWSNQYDLKLQTVGLSIGHDQEVLRGDPATRSFSIVYLKHGRVVALDCVNASRDYAQGKALVEQRMVVEPRHLADCERTLKELLAAAPAPSKGNECRPCM